MTVSHDKARRLGRRRPRPAHTFARWRETSRQHDVLAKLDPHILTDIGRNPTQAARASQRWFWDL